MTKKAPDLCPSCLTPITARQLNDDGEWISYCNRLGYTGCDGGGCIAPSKEESIEQTVTSIADKIVL